MTDTIPAPAPQPVQQKNGRSTASLVLGIVSLFVNPLAIATIFGIIFGILGLRASSAMGGRNKAIVGIILSVVGFFVGIIVFFSIVSGIGSAANTASHSLTTPAAAPSSAAAPAKAAAPTKASSPAPVTKAPAAPVVPAEYLNALTQAKSYDSTAHLSKKGLLKQLTSSYGGQFPKKAAEYAVKNVGADWNANALAQAKDYEQTAHLSNASLHDQLVSAYGGQFTESQADYAIKHLND